MNNVTRTFLAVALSTAFLLPSGASAKDLVKGKLEACPTGSAIGDVNSCGKIWKIKSGKGSVSSKGELKVSVKGLVLNDASVGEFNGTPDGVTHVVGAVLCGGALAGETKWVPLSKKGNASIKGKIKLPSNCASPVIVVREVYEGKVGGWLAATSH